MSIPSIGFIGFGEAAFYISDGLISDGIQHVHAFDIMANDPVVGQVIKVRANSANVNLASSLSELIESSNVIFCATSAKYALAIAKEAASFVRKKQHYVDLNSASPKVKKEIASVIGGSGALFVDAAVMEVVPPYRHKVPISVSGEGAFTFATLVEPYGMNITVINDQPGSASAMKMTRSIFMKGFTALLTETLIAAYKTGIDKEIMASIKNTLSNHPLEELVNLLMTRTAIHAERRVSEMEEVISTLKEMKLDYSISQATKGKLQQLVDMELNTYLNHTAPDHYHQVLEAIIKK